MVPWITLEVASALFEEFEFLFEIFVKVCEDELMDIGYVQVCIYKIKLLNLSLVFTSGGNICLEIYKVYCGDWF